MLIYRAGRDASRAYVTGCFETHLTPDLRGFGEAEMKASISSRFMLNTDEQALSHWKTFFANHKEYEHVGRVLNPKIDPSTPIPEMCRPVGEGAPGADAARHGKSMPQVVKKN